VQINHLYIQSRLKNYKVGVLECVAGVLIMCSP